MLKVYTNRNQEIFVAESLEQVRGFYRGKAEAFSARAFKEHKPEDIVRFSVDPQVYNSRSWPVKEGPDVKVFLPKSPNLPVRITAPASRWIEKAGGRPCVLYSSVLGVP